MATPQILTRADVNILFGETNGQLKLGLRQALRAEGYVRIREVVSAPDVRSAIIVDSPDLAILDAALDPDMAAAVRDLRHGKYGLNPFVPVIMTSWVAEAELIRRLMNSGADEILLKPLSIIALMERINSMVSRRKPYLATKDYIGPDRRGGRPDPNAPGMTLIHPPNTFRAKIEGKPIAREELLAQVRATQTGMAEQRMTRDLSRIVNLARSVLDASSQGRHDQKLHSELDQLAGLGSELAGHLAGTPLSQVVPVLDNIQRTATDLRDNLPNVDERKVKLLPPMAEAVNAIITSPEARRHISDIVSIMREAREKKRDGGAADAKSG